MDKLDHRIFAVCYTLHRTSYTTPIEWMHYQQPSYYMYIVNLCSQLSWQLSHMNKQTYMNNINMRCIGVFTCCTMYIISIWIHVFPYKLLKWYKFHVFQTLLFESLGWYILCCFSIYYVQFVSCTLYSKKMGKSKCVLVCISYVTFQENG